MKLIDIPITRIDSNNKQTMFLRDAIENNKLIVLLGNPGSGKTSLLKKYYNEHRNYCDLFTVKKFIEMDISSIKDIVLLDGLDEYRSIKDDKNFITSELGHNINKRLIAGTSIVISCREMDWYGTPDTEALEESVKKDKAVLYSVNSLDKEHMLELAEALEMSPEAQNSFLSKFSDYVLLDNPHMFCMLANLHMDKKADNIKSKTDLYEYYIKESKERNTARKRNKVNQLEPQEMLKYTGYLALYYVFARTNKFNEKLLDNICDAEHGYPLEKLEGVLNTNLFQNKTFTHRTLAEFSAAYYLAYYKLTPSALTSVATSRVKRLFVTKKNIPTELRGTYAWLCALTKNQELIDQDPYYQAIYGDNAQFHWELKKQIICSVKKLAQASQYFIDNFEKLLWDSHTLTGFYTQELDDTLIKELEFSLESSREYFYFIWKILFATDSLSKKIKEHIKKIIVGKIKMHVDSDQKFRLLQCVKDDIDFLKNIFGKVESGEIEDEDRYLSHLLLGILYPDHVSPEKIHTYINIEDGSWSSEYMYLLNPIPYEKKYALIDALHKKFPNKIRGYFSDMPIGIRSFFDEYFFETLHKYNEDGEHDAKCIYGIIKHFKKYYDEYASINFSSLTSNKKTVDSNDKNRMQKLTDEIFSVYIDDNLDAIVDQPMIIPNFRRFYYTHPTDENAADILFSKMSDSNSSKTNKILFKWGYNFYSQATVKKAQIDSIAKKYGLSEVLHNLRNPEKQKWEIEQEKHASEERKKEKETRAKNEKYFSAYLHDNAKSLAFRDLHFISKFVFNKRSNRPLKDKTFVKLKQLLKQKIHDDLIGPDLLTIKSLVEFSPHGLRNIDTMYYSSLALHNNRDTEDFENDIRNKSDFYDYLYINSLMKKGISGVIQTNFSDVVEKKRNDRANKALMKFIELLLQKYIQGNTAEILLKYIINHTKKHGIEEIKRVVFCGYSTDRSIEDIGEELLYKWLSTFNLSVMLDDLQILAAGKRNEGNKKIISALIDIIENNKKSFSVDKAIAMHDILFGAFPSPSEKFLRLSSKHRIRVIDYILDQFNSPQSLQPKKTTSNGIATEVTGRENCIFFLQQEAFYKLEFDELKKLESMRNKKADIWKSYIDKALTRMQQIESDKAYAPLDITETKEFILNNKIASSTDFFEDVREKIKELKCEIENNRDNEKNMFFNGEQPKGENDCRDQIVILLKRSFEKIWRITREKHEANNRADINIFYKNQESFEVQIECKKSDSSELNTGINQLKDKYLSKGVPYGIYLVFDFKHKMNESKVKDLEKQIPQELIDDIKIIVINLSKTNNN